MERLHHNTTSHANSQKDTSLSGGASTNHHNTTSSASTNKKWSFGRLFRRKKEHASESSSEEDRKAGFIPTQRNSRVTATTGGSSANLKPKLNKSNKVSRSSKLNGASFDHIVLNPHTGAPITPPHLQPPPPPHVDHEFFLPVETISPTEAYFQNRQQQQHYQGAPAAGHARSSNSLDRRAARAAFKTRSAQRLPHETALGAHSSSEEELISLNSSTFSKYRSDESIHSGGQGAGNNAGSRRSRAARNERYYKRLSRDGEPSNGQVPVMYAPQPAQRWKTQPVPLSIYNPSAAPPSAAATAVAAATPRLRNTSSLQHVAPYVQWGQLQQQPKQLQNTVNDSKRSISYDSHIHLQNINGRQQIKPLPPPPPPRDPLRRVNMGSGQLQNGSSGDLRPISYAFDQSGLPVLPATSQRLLSGRCVSDDKIWSGPAGPHYQSVHSLNTPTVTGQQQVLAPSATPHHRRFITRAERDAQPGKKSLPNGIEFHYVTDATPRSRKPIHMLEPQPNASSKEPSSRGILRTSKSGLPSSSKHTANDFWKRMDTGSQHQRGRDAERPLTADSNIKPRSLSSSRVGELRAYPIPVYSEVQKPHKKPQTSPQPGVDEVNNIVCGSLHIKSKPDNASANYVEIRDKDYSKSSSMPNHYQRRSGEIPNTPNKYDEYVAEKREQYHKPIFNTPTPPQRKLSIPPSHVAELPIYFPRKKPANLEEAINELEAIYKSLGLTEEPEPKKERIPTPSEFDKYALAHADDYDDEDSPAGEPDPIRDDVAYRNMQLANLQHKTAEKQPPFGIPIGPVIAAPQTDYLHVTPIVEPPSSPLNSPDIVKDDLAVRALRKDPPGPKDKFTYPYSSLQKKNRATRTQSANIYNLIHRDAAKPSGGGDLLSYLELTRNHAGSMSDLHKDDSDTAADVPATLALLRNLRAEEQQLAAPKKADIPFRHPSQGGAICALPKNLPSKEEMHKAPVPLPRKSLTPEPTAANAQMEDALNKIAMDAQEKSEKLTRELQELRKEALITAALPKTSNITTEEEKLEKDLQEIEAVSAAAKRCGKMLLDTLPDVHETQALSKPRKLHKEGKLIEAIDQVSEAANAVCEKILKDIVTTEPPVVLQEAVQVKNKQTPTETLVMPNLIKKLDPIQSEQIEAIAKRCMRQLSALADDNPDYDNLNQELTQQTVAAANSPPALACNAEHIHLESAPKVDNLVYTVAELTQAQQAKAKQSIEEIDQIMQECEEKVRAETSSSAATSAPAPLPTKRQLPPMTTNSSGDDRTTAPSMTTTSCSSSNSNAAGVVAAGVVNKTGASTTASSFSSSSDCLAKSSSPSAGRRQSSSITSFNPYSSSDYIKSPSSEFHTPSTDPIKTFSTSSYDVQSTTPNISATTNSTFSYTPSPPLQLTAVSAERAAITVADAAARKSQERTRSLSSPSQYNSSEELAMIFGIDEQPRRQRVLKQPTDLEPPTNISGKDDVSKSPSVPLTSSNHASAHQASLLDTATTITTTASATQLLTNPNTAVCATACECVEPSTTNKTKHLNVIVVVDNINNVLDLDVEDATPIDTTNSSSTIIATTNPSTITTNSNTKNSPTTITRLSPSTSYKLESIPESVGENASKMQCSALKLPPNFNKIYASKISIVVDNVAAPPARHVALTQCDSLSSCEDETSSNPDSGNVSLADFPLAAHTNNVCLQLESACNSRFEVKKNYVSEVAIEREEAEREVVVSSDSNKIEILEFPSPPSVEELLDSLIDASLENMTKQRESKKEVQEHLVESEFKEKEIVEIESELIESNEGSEYEDATESAASVDDESLDTRKQSNNSTAEVEICYNSNSRSTQITIAVPGTELLQNCTPVERKENTADELDDMHLIELAKLVRSSSRRNSTSTSDVETNEASKPNEFAYNTSARICTELDHLRLAFTELLERNLTELDELPRIAEEDAVEMIESIALDNSNVDNCFENTKDTTQQRKHSVVYETPPLNLNISEVKISYTASDAGEKNVCASSDILTQIVQCTNELEQLNEALNELPRHKAAQKEKPNECALTTDTTLTPWRRRTNCEEATTFDDEEPSTSAAAAAKQQQRSRALSVFGELRPVAGSLTTLEHVLMACSLGVITPTDLYTLCLIIIGMITIIAIALF